MVSLFVTVELWFKGTVQYTHVVVPVYVALRSLGPEDGPDILSTSLMVGRGLPG